MSEKDVRTLVLACVALPFFWAGRISYAAEFRYGTLGGPGDPSSPEVVVISGVIKRGDYGRLLSFARGDQSRFLSRMVLLSSAGGDIHEAMKIGGLIKATYQSVFVNSAVGRCASACFLIYVSAVERDATLNSVGIHRPYFSPEYFSRLSLSEAESKHEALLDEVRVYLERREVPQYLVEKMFSMASDEVYWLSDADINRVGRRVNWYDQVLVDRCGLDKKLERGFIRDGNRFEFAEEARAKIAQVAACAAEISSTEGVENLHRLLAQGKDVALEPTLRRTIPAGGGSPPLEPTPPPCPGMAGLEIGQTRTFSFERMAVREPAKKTVTRDLTVVHTPAERPWTVDVTYASNALDAKVIALHYLVDPPSGLYEGIIERYGKGTPIASGSGLLSWEILPCNVRLRYRTGMSARQRRVEELWVETLSARNR